MSNLKDSILLNGRVYAVGNDAIMAPVFPLETVKLRPAADYAKPKETSHAQHNHIRKKAKTARRTARHLAAHKRQRSQTLMRHVVKKPHSSKSQTMQNPAKAAEEPKTNLFTYVPNAGRVKRAIETPKSRHISRFHRARHVVHVKRNIPLAVKAAPRMTSFGQNDELGKLIKSLTKA